MVHGLRDLRRGYLWSLEGGIGRVTDVYFDDLCWEIRYLVIDTGWLGGRRVLVSRAETRDVTAADFRSGETVATDSSLATSGLTTMQDDADAHLRSARDVVGYSVNGIDGSLGRAADLLFDLHAWSVRYLIISTRRWWAGKRVLVRPGLVEELDWFHRCAKVQLSRTDVGARGSGKLPLRR